MTTTATTTTATTYYPMREEDLPLGLIFDTPGRNQGQVPEASYADWGTLGNAYMRVDDDGVITFYQRKETLSGGAANVDLPRP